MLIMNRWKHDIFYIGKGSWLIDIHRKIPYNTFYESPFLQDITIYLFRNLGFKSVLYCTAICSYWRVYLLYSISSSKAVNPFDLYKGILNCAPCCCWRGFAPNMRYCAELWPGTRPGHINYNLEDRGHQTCQPCLMFDHVQQNGDYNWQYNNFHGSFFIFESWGSGQLSKGAVHKWCYTENNTVFLTLVRTVKMIT